MKRIVAAIAFLAAGATAASAQTAPSVAVDQAWARATPLGARTGAVYMTLTNHSAVDDRLVGASTPVAAQAQLHETTMSDGIMKMHHASGVDVKAGATVTLAPGGYHVMLLGLQHPLREGETFPLTLNFTASPPQQIEVHVAKIGAMQPDAAGAGGGMASPRMSK